MNDWASLLPFVLIVLVFWFLVVRPARKQQQRLAQTQAAVAVGSEVMLGSGIYGRVAAVGEETLELEVAPGTRVKVARQAVVKVLSDGERASEDSSFDERPAEHRPEDPSSDPQA